MFTPEEAQVALSLLDRVEVRGFQEATNLAAIGQKFVAITQQATRHPDEPDDPDVADATK